MNPPLAKITALRAPMRWVAPSGVAASTPVTAPPSITTRWTRWETRMSTPSSRAFAAIVRMLLRPPSDIDSRASVCSHSVRPNVGLSGS